MAAPFILAATANASATPVLFADTGMSSMPTSMTTDSSGNVYVVRSSPSALAKVAPSGALTASWATRPGGDSWNRVVTGLDNAVYASGDTGSNPYIQKLAADGSIAQSYTTDASDAPTGIAVDASGNVFYITTSGTSKVVKITAGNTVAATSTVSFQTSSIALDASGNVYVAGISSGTSKLVRFSNDLTNPHDYNVDYGSLNGCLLTARGSYVYCAYKTNGSSARVARIEGLTFDNSWATIPGAGMDSPDPKALQAGSDGFLYVTSSIQGQTGSTGLVSKIPPSGATTELATTTWAPLGLTVDPSTNVFISRVGMGGPTAVSGIYKIAQAAPTPAPTPTPTPGPTPTPAATTLATPTVNTSAPGKNAVVTVRTQLGPKGKYTFIFEKPTANEMSREQATSTRVAMQKGTRLGKRTLKKRYTAAVITTTADNAKVVTRALLRKAQARKLNLRVVYAPTGTAQSESVIKIK